MKILTFNVKALKDYLNRSILTFKLYLPTILQIFNLKTLFLNRMPSYKTFKHVFK